MEKGLKKHIKKREGNLKLLYEKSRKRRIYIDEKNELFKQILIIFILIVMISLIIIPKEINNLNVKYLILNNNYKMNWQTPEKVINYIKENLTKPREIIFFDIYEK